MVGGLASVRLHRPSGFPSQVNSATCLLSGETLSLKGGYLLSVLLTTDNILTAAFNRRDIVSKLVVFQAVQSRKQVLTLPFSDTHGRSVI